MRYAFLNAFLLNLMINLMIMFVLKECSGDDIKCPERNLNDPLGDDLIHQMYFLLPFLSLALYFAFFLLYIPLIYAIFRSF
jgi:hypothetical protein